MQLRFFTVPILGGEDAAEELNRFLGAHRILAVDRYFVQDGANSAWAPSVGNSTMLRGGGSRPGTGCTGCGWPGIGGMGCGGWPGCCPPPGRLTSARGKAAKPVTFT